MQEAVRPAKRATINVSNVLKDKHRQKSNDSTRTAREIRESLGSRSLGQKLYDNEDERQSEQDRLTSFERPKTRVRSSAA